MKNLIYILLLSACTTSVFAQIPGYLGKRISIEGDLNLMPNFTNFFLGNTSRQSFRTRNDIDYVYNPDTGTHVPETVIRYYRATTPIRNKNNMRWTFKPSLAVNFTLSRKMDLSLRFNKIYGNFKYDDYSMRLNNGIFFEENLKYHASEIDLNFKFYRRNFLAPVGKYLLFGIGYSKVIVRESTGTLLSNIDDYYNIGTEDSEKEVTVNHSVNFLKFNIGIGNKTILKENLFLTYALEYNNYRAISNSSVNGGYALYNFRENASRNLSKNLNYDHYFCAKLGIGIML